MRHDKTHLAGLVVFHPDVYSDERGAFHECYRETWFAEMTSNTAFVQDNMSVSNKGVLRGLHYQNPNDQGKLVHVVHGAAFDVAVDLRRDSSTFGKWFGIELSASNNRLLWIPSGFAHGFQALEDGTVFHYKCSDYYERNSEHSLRWDDPDIAIDWPLANPRVSQKDAAAKYLHELTATELF